MDAILGFIQQNMVMIGFVVGLLVKYQPKLKWVPNEFIPYANIVIGLLAQLFGPADAHAGVLGGVFSIASPFLVAGWDAIKSALIYEIFGRHVIERRLGWKKA